MNIDQVIQWIETQTENSLTPLQKGILQGAWENKKYSDIAHTLGYNSEYVKDVASLLWQQISKLLGKKVTKKTIKRELEKVLITSATPKPTNIYQDWGEAPDVPVFWGRTTELETLKKWILEDSCRLVAIVGFAGIGKTDLSLKLAQGIQNQFDYLIWRSLLNSPPITDILKDLNTSFGQQKLGKLPDSLDAYISSLINHLRQHRCLLILDNVETLLQERTGKGDFRQGYKEYEELFQAIATVSHQSCCLLTSQEKPETLCQLASFSRQTRFLELGGLNEEEGKKLFTLIEDESQTFKGSPKQWQELIQFYYGNPLGLKLVANHIKEVFDSNISEFIAQEKPIFDDVRNLLNYHFYRLSLPEEEIMTWLAINREFTSFEQLKADLLSPYHKTRLSDTLQTLQRRIPLEKRESKFSLQPMLMKYVTEIMIEDITAEINSNHINRLNNLLLLKALAKDYVRETQISFIIQPILQQLVYDWRNYEKLAQQLEKMLQIVQQKPITGYAADNLINLLYHLRRMKELDEYQVKK
ncbi:MAG: NB-ARC domain-containing protein [Crocosphaera sp.]|nr:NB-ARC domain-containing protein [Crocosphaera sp.]